MPHLVPLAAAHMLVAVTGAIVAEGFLAFAALADVRFNWGTIMYYCLAFDPMKAEVAWNVFLPSAPAISLFCGAFYLMSLGVREVADRSLQEAVELRGGAIALDVGPR